MLQVPELKYTVYGSYMWPLGNRGFEVFSNYSWVDDVYYSPFERKRKWHLRTVAWTSSTWKSPDEKWVVSGFVNNVMDEVGILQALRAGEAEHFRHTAGTTLPRLYGLEVTYTLGDY